MTTYYEILGIKSNANETQIRKAYLIKSRTEHPDRHREDPKRATARFQEISTAYETLNDPEKKRQYDIAHAEEILKEGKKKEIMQLLSRLDNEVESFINTLCSPDIPEQERIIPKKRVTTKTMKLLQKYQTAIRSAMQQVYYEESNEKWSDILQDLIKEATETANNRLIASEPAITGFFNKIINAIKNFLNVLFPSIKTKVGEGNKKIVRQFKSINAMVETIPSPVKTIPSPVETIPSPVETIPSTTKLVLKSDPKHHK